MLKIKDNVDLKELEKYGFKILITDKQFEKRIKKDDSKWYCVRARRNVGNHHLEIEIENDIFENQITIIPDNKFPFRMAYDFQLDILFDLINDGLVEKVKNE